MDVQKEHFDVIASLEQFHSIFYVLWDLGTPVVTDSIDTAAVRYNYNNGKYFEFLINEKFWNSLSLYDKQFIICHESLHVIFRHGIRGKDSKDQDTINLAMDIAVNHALVNYFRFERDKITNADSLCWTDTIFPEHKDLSTELSFEQYYVMMEKEKTKKSDASLVDDHGPMFTGEGAPEDVWKEIAERLPDEDKKTIKDILDTQEDSTKKSRGSGTSIGKWFNVKEKPVRKKKKWETIVKKWAKAFMKNSEDIESQWVHQNRRFVNIESELILPSDSVIEHRVLDRFDVWFFMDSSGSCIGYKDRFFAAARSIPEENFVVRAFSFDTSVYEVDLKSPKLRGGYGTYFNIIETKIQTICKNEKKQYPKAVFIITDGCGNKVNPEYPERWFWFLTERETRFIPKESHIYNLKNFE